MSSVANTTPVRLPGPSLLHDLVSTAPKTARAEGNAAIDALLFDGSRVQVSYSHLHARADEIAQRLRRYLPMGGNEQAVVPLLLRQAPDLYTTQLAILKAGAAFCPLNLDAPPERIRFIVGDVKAKVLVTTSDLVDSLPSDFPAQVLILDRLQLEDCCKDDEACDSRPPLQVTAESLAYVLYTSGSTGTPKGVGVPHGSVTQSLLAHHRHIPSFDRFLQFAAPTFDVSVFEIFFPLFRGATLVCCDRNAMVNDLPGMMRRLDVDACELTPTVAGSLLRTRDAAPCLKLLLTIGEMLSEPVVKEFGGAPGRESMLWAMYGPTEAAIHCTLAPALSADASTGHIGIPLDTVSCFVISQDFKYDDATTFEVVPLGDVGELVVGGHQNAAGYLNRPEQTAQAFVNSPFGPVYRTGDLARMSPDGSIECLGRMSDGQVKLRGQRIELGEIEQAVLRSEGCHGAVAAVISHILVAFCAVDAEAVTQGPALVQVIRETCAGWLPSFMVPRDIVLLTEFPRLASGKVDRKRLTGEYRHPESLVEDADDDGSDEAVRLVKDATRELLGGLGMNSNLAAAGLDSLVAIKLASQLRRAGLDVSAAHVLQAPTLADLCLAMSETQRVQSSSDETLTLAVPPLEEILDRHEELRPFQDNVAFVLPTTPLQTSMLAETSMNGQAYWNEIFLAFPTHYSTTDIADAFRQLARCNEVLRTGFVHHGRSFIQLVFQDMLPHQVSVVSDFSSGTSDLMNPLLVEIQDSTGSNGRLVSLRLHHSVYDGWTVDMILSDLHNLLSRTEVKPRPQFSEVVAFYESLTERHMEVCRFFWAQHLLGWQKPSFPKLLRKAKVSDQVVTTARFQLHVSPDQVAAVAKHLSVSPQVPFQAALLWLWAGLVGIADVVVGSVTSGRTVPVTDVERVMGPCIASMPLRADLSGAEKVRDLLSLVHTGNRAILQHATVPLADIKRIANVTSGDGLYDVLFVYQESLDNTKECLVRQISHRDFLETPVLVEVEPDTTGFACQITHHSSLVPAAFADILLEQFDTVVSAMVQDADARLESLRERFQFKQLSVYNPQVKHLAGCPDLASLVEATAAKTPHRAAVHVAHSILNDDVQGDVLTYAGLNSQANTIAQLILTADSAAADAPVMIIMEKSTLLYISILAIIKAGRAYLPLLPSTPNARIQAIVDRAKVSLLISDSASFSALSNLTCQTLDVETVSLDPNFSEDNPIRGPDPSRAAYVIYTSGTTGVPKGVVVTEQNIVSNLETLQQIYPVSKNGGSRLLQACSQAFDVSVFEIFFAWKTGMCLCTGTNDVLFGDLEQTIRNFGITHLSMTPTVAGLVRRQAVPCVQFLVTAGEAMTQAVFDEWGDLLYQGYGPSETTNICTVKRMEEGDHIQHLGHSFENTSAFVLYPDSLIPVPVGAVGELCFGGDQVASGYLNELDLTTEKFVTMPNFGRVYRSGDLGRMLDDGSLVIMGRLDGQVKLRGQRIDVGEIESVVALTKRTAGSVAVIVRRSDEAPDQLAVFYTLEHDVPTTDCHLLNPESDNEARQALFAALEAALPAYMVPSYLVPLSSLPRTASGKIDHKALAVVFRQATPQGLHAMSRRLDEGALDTEWSGAEKQVAGIIKSSMNLDDGTALGRWTPLAAIGLDSISAIAVARDLSRELGRRVTVSEILQNPTISLLATRVARSEALELDVDKTETDWFSEAFLNTVSQKLGDAGLKAEKVLPCTALQEAMLAAGSTSYYNRMVLRLSGVPARELRPHWEAMVDRHGILRTCFFSTDDASRPFAQVVVETSGLQWHVAGQDILVDRQFSIMEDNLGNAVDSMTPPLSFSVLFRDGEPLLLFLCHHAVYDGVAMSNLFAEVEQLATGGALPPPVSFGPFLRQSLVVDTTTDGFWRKHFNGFRPARFDLGKNRATRNSNSLSVRLSTSLKTVETKVQALGLSHLSVFQAAWATTIRIATKQADDVCFGNVVSGRGIPVDGVERLVAPCFNTVPLRVNNSSPTLKSSIELFRYLHRLNLDVMPHQFTPLRRVQRLVGCQGLFDSLLLLQPPKRPLNADVWEVVSDEGAIDVPLVCEIVPDAESDEILVTLHYYDDLPEKFVGAIADAVDFILAFSVHYPSSSIPKLEDLPDHIQLAIRLVPMEKKPHDAAASRLGSTDSSQPKVPWSPVELRMRKVLSDLAKIPESNISRDTTIFQLGLDSVNAVQVAAVLRDHGMNVVATDIIGHPTCQALGRRLLDKDDADAFEGATSAASWFDFDKFRARVAESVPQTLAGTADALLPCTPVQCAMLTEFVRSRGENYLNYLHLDLYPDVGLDEAAAGWAAVFSTHAMLRTGFLAIEDEENPEITHAMVKYAATMRAPPVSTHTGSVSNFNVATWRRDARLAILKSLEEPPWKVMLLHDEARGRLSMHIVIHHALYDAQSLNFILDDLARSMMGIKNASVTSVESALRALLRTTSHKRQGPSEAFWKSLADKTVVNSFPIMTPLRVESGEVSCHSVAASLSMKDLRYATQAANISIQAALQAAWTRVLSSYIGEDSVVFGVVMSGRTAETQDAVFPCITTVPIVARNVKSNQNLLRSMMDFNKNLYAHQFSRLADIQRWTGHAGAPLFDTLLVYQRGGSEAKLRRPWTVARDDGFVDFPLSLEVEPDDGGVISLRVTYRTDVVPQEQAAVLVRQFDGALRHLVLDADGNEDGLWDRSPELFSVLPALQGELPSDARLLHELVEMRSRQQPDKIALQFVSAFDADSQAVAENWTYAELNSIGDRVAAHLQAMGVSARSIVAVHFDKCPEAYFSLLGILKAGCCFLALDPEAPEARKSFILEDSQARALLVRESGNLGFETDVKTIEINPHVLKRLDSLPTGADSGSQKEILASDCCYCLYTSGTTGVPKGCDITHENSVQALMAFKGLFRGHWDASSKWLQFASLHFDVSVLEQYWSWSVGMTVVAAPRDLVLDDIEGTIRALGITHIDLTPSLASLVKPENVPSLWKGVFITGGEQLKQDILDVWGPKAVVYNAYGPTEATIGVTMRRRVPATGRPANIGHQFPNVGTYVLQPETDLPVLKGGVGELCVSGKLVGKGYRNRPELTAERFPVLGRFRERVYRTGDLVRLLSDASFDFLGRADDQVKLRGQRLQLGEINHAIKSGTPNVQDVATVVVRHGRTGKDLLVAFVTSQPNKENQARGPLEVVQTPESARLCRDARAACLRKVPGYMVPTYIVELRYIPLSRNNKAELKDLRRLFEGLSAELVARLSAATSSDSPASGPAWAAPQLSGVAKTVMGVVASFCRVEIGGIDAQTSLFDLGVDSLTLPRLARTLRRNGVQGTSSETLLRHPRLGDLVNALTDMAAGQELQRKKGLVAEARQAMRACGHRHVALACRELGLQADDIEYVVPCTPLQQGIVARALAGDGGGKGTYFNTFAFRLHQDVHLGRMRSAWEAVVARLAILRTNFLATPDGFVQIARKGEEIRWTELDGAGEEQHERLADAFDQWIVRNSTQVLSPLEFFISRHAPLTDGATLTIHIFHGIYDGLSFDLILRAVAACYSSGGSELKGPSFLDALPLGPLMKHECCRDFWLHHLRGWSPADTSLHLSRADPKVSSEMEPDVSAKIVIQPGHVETLGAAARALGVTLQSVVLALWISVLQRFAPTSATTTGVIVSGRGAIDIDGIEDVIGPLFNTLPFFSGHVSREHGQNHVLAALIRRCHDFNAAVSAFQHVPLRDIRRWCHPGETRALFDNLFAFQVEKDERDDAFASLWTGEEDLGPMRADYPLAFEATVRPSGTMQVLALASGSTADEESLKSALGQFEEAIISLGGQGEQGWEALSLSTSSDNMSRMEAKTGPDSDEDPATRDTVDNERQEGFSMDLGRQARIFLDEMSIQSGLPLDRLYPRLSLVNLGLDSIDTVRLSAKLKTLGVSLGARDMTRRQELGAMVDLLQSESETGNEISVAESRKEAAYHDLCARLATFVEEADPELWRDSEEVLPPTPLQETMVAQMLGSDFDRYFNHDVLEISAGVDIDLLKNAWAVVYQRNPVLRTVFVQVPSAEVQVSFCQVVIKGGRLPVPTCRIESMDRIESVMEEARAIAKKGGARHGLFQVRLVIVGERRLILLSIGHALYDGWSLALLHQDVADAYRGNVVERPSPSLALQRLISPDDTAQWFWSGYLADAEPTILLKETTPSRESGEIHRMEAGSTVSLAEISTFGKTHGISLQVLGQACWAAVLGFLTKSLDLTFGVVVSGRDWEGSDQVLFPTMNTVAVRSVLHGDGLGFLGYMEDGMRGVRDAQSFPLRRAVAAAAKGKGRLFDTLFLLQKAPPKANREGGEESILTSVESVSGVEYPVCVELEIVDGGLLWRTACDESVLRENEVGVMLHHLDEALQFLLGDPRRDILEFGQDGVSVCGLPPVQISRQSWTVEETTATTDDNLGASTWTEGEDTIRAVLSQISGVPTADIPSSAGLYNLGLDSISAIKVAANLRQRGVSLSVRQLLTARSVAEMASIAAEVGTKSTPTSRAMQTHPSGDEKPLLDGDKICEAAGIASEEVEMVLPALPMQIYMLSAWHNTNGAVFFPEFRYRLSGVVDEATLTSAWEACVAQNAVLRTCFVCSRHQSDWPIAQLVLRQESTTVQSRLKIGFDNQFKVMESDDLLGLWATKDGDGSWILELRIHHALYDAVSLAGLMRRMWVFCDPDRSSGSLEETPLADWAAFVSSQASKRAQSERQRFWTSYLGGLSRQEEDDAPSATQTSSETGNLRRRRSLFVPGAVSDLRALKRTCASNGISFQALFFATYGTLLVSASAPVSNSRYSMAEDGSKVSQARTVVFGVYLANRAFDNDTSHGFETYPTLNLVPLKVHVGRGEDVMEIAVRVQQDLLEIGTGTNATVGLWEVSAWTGVTVDAFVNFLGTDVLESTVDPQQLSDSKPRIELLESPGPQDSGGDFSVPKWLRNNVVANSYPDSIDVEASITDAGLNIGIFGAEEALAEEEAGAIVDSILKILTTCARE